jgi:hypothetical protein
LARVAYLIFPLVLLCLLAVPQSAKTQSSGYELLPSPDLWYNDVDGIRAGLRLKGQVPGTFDDGPHRLDFGVWLGTWFPDNPVSYYLSFTEPIPSWSDFGSEANVALISSVRTGYHRHGIRFSKRWQTGFDERRYQELSLFQSYERRFEKEYVPFPELWSEDDKLLTSLLFELKNDNALGWYSIFLDGRIQYLDDFSSGASFTAMQEVPLHRFWKLSLRWFAGFNSENSQPEYLYTRSGLPAQEWLQSGWTRAKGTIPTPWITSGYVQVTGGANVRGYTYQDYSDTVPLTRSVTSFNSELDFWNPIGSLIEKSSYIADFVDFRSYLFFDAGSGLGSGSSLTEDWIADAGAGFSFGVNIPDNLGKTRGFVIRFDLPFWLSDPLNEDPFEFRHLFSFGAVISI